MRKIKKRKFHTRSKNQTNKPNNIAQENISTSHYLNILCRYAQFTFILFLLLNPGTAVFAKTILKDNSKMSEETREFCRKTCTDKTYGTTNKPNEMIVRMNGETMVSDACLSPMMNEALCKKENEELRFFKSPNKEKVENARKAAALKHQAWVEVNSPSLMHIAKSLPGAQQLAFMKMIDVISFLYSSRLNQQVLKTCGESYCGDHVDNALLIVLEHAMEKGENLKAQMIEVAASKSKNVIKDHTYLVLDSHLQDIEIRQPNKQQVSRILSAFKNDQDSLICDPWNRYAIESKNEVNGLGNPNAGWDTIKIQTRSLDFSEFKKMAITAQEALCRLLTDVGLPLRPKSLCARFTRGNSKTEL